MTTQGQGPLNDPRLTERRGDLSGLNAALFVILVVAAFGAAAYLLATLLNSGGQTPTPSPVRPSAAASASARPGSLSPSASASGSVLPSASPSGSAGANLGLKQPIPIVLGGQTIGTVTVTSIQYPSTVAGNSAGAGLRWLAAKVRYSATAAVTYSPGNWSVEDAAGKRYQWAGTDFKPALGSGSAAAGQKAAGNVTFRVPTSGTLTLVFSGGDAEQRILLPAQ